MLHLYQEVNFGADRSWNKLLERFRNHKRTATWKAAVHVPPSPLAIPQPVPRRPLAALEAPRHAVPRMADSRASVFRPVPVSPQRWTAPVFRREDDGYCSPDVLTGRRPAFSPSVSSAKAKSKKHRSGSRAGGRQVDLQYGTAAAVSLSYVPEPLAASLTPAEGKRQSKKTQVVNVGTAAQRTNSGLIFLFFV